MPHGAYWHPRMLTDGAPSAQDSSSVHYPVISNLLILWSCQISQTKLSILKSFLVSLQNVLAVAAAPAPAYWPAAFNSSEAVHDYPYFRSQPNVINLGWLLVWSILVASNTICTPLLAIAAAPSCSTGTHLTCIYCAKRQYRQHSQSAVH